ncbi:MAG: hypothetical protein QNJ09_14865 [Paracoccaceae bacterium]|nr:hypothetical protein [Paracoccaceae bacterium]
MSQLDSALNVLFISAFPLILWLIKGSTVSVLSAIVQIVLFAMALRLISKGQKLQAEYDSAPAAHRPFLPRKIAGSLLIGTVVMILSSHHFAGFILPGALGLVATGLGIAAFGPDPLRDKRTASAGNPQVSRSEALVRDFETALDCITDDINRLGDAELTQRTEAGCDVARTTLHSVADNERELLRLCKPLAKFIELLDAEVARLEQDWQGEDTDFARRRYVAKLDVLAQSFAERMRKSSKRNGKHAFDVEADILMGRMQQETAA